MSFSEVSLCFFSGNTRLHSGNTRSPQKNACLIPQCDSTLFYSTSIVPTVDDVIDNGKHVHFNADLSGYVQQVEWMTVRYKPQPYDIRNMGR